MEASSAGEDIIDLGTGNPDIIVALIENNMQINQTVRGVRKIM
jgi:hypothetical protein